MPNLTSNPALARKRADALRERLNRYPDHPQKAHMEEMLVGYEEAAKAAPEPVPEDKGLARVEVLVASIRKMQAQLADAATPPEMVAGIEARIAQYQTSLKNIRDYGRETIPASTRATKIEVPADVLAASSK